MLPRLKQLIIVGFQAMGLALLSLLPARTRLGIRAKLGVVRPMDYSSHRILLHIDSDLEWNTRRFSCANEPETVAWIESFRAGDVLYDIGANVGAYSLIAAMRHGGTVPVYAFEPAFLNYSQLCRNVALNSCQGRIIPLCLALGDRTTLMPLHYQNLIVGGSLHASGEARDYRGEPFTPVCSLPTLTARLDDLIAWWGLPAPTHLKLDVDGTEDLVLAGAMQALKGVQTILMEVNEAETRDLALLDTLDHLGFGTYSRHPCSAPFLTVANYVLAR